MTDAINAKSEALELHELSSEELDAVSGGGTKAETRKRGTRSSICRQLLQESKSKEKPLHKDGWYLRRSGGGSGGRCRSCLKTAKTRGLDVPTYVACPRRRGDRIRASFAAVHEFLVGTKRTSRDVRHGSAFGSKAEVGFRRRQVRF